MSPGPLFRRMHDIRVVEADRNSVPRRPCESLIREVAERVHGLCHVCGVSRGQACGRDSEWMPECPPESARYIGRCPIGPLELKLLSVYADGQPMGPLAAASSAGIQRHQSMRLAERLIGWGYLRRPKRGGLLITSSGLQALAAREVAA